MSKSAALKLAALLQVNVPTRGAANALWDLCVERGWNIAVEHDTGDWVVLDAEDRELARCA
jgi:hypothetical protein